MPKPVHPVKAPHIGLQPPANSPPAGRVRYRKRLEEVRDLVDRIGYKERGVNHATGRALEVLASICQELADEVDLARREKL